VRPAGLPGPNASGVDVTPRRVDRRGPQRLSTFRGRLAPRSGRERRVACYSRRVKLAVVIPALDEADRIEETVGSATAPGVEVIVVDGGSTDDTVERASRAGARVIESASGRARQLALGAAACGAEAIVFLHADTHLPPGFARAVRDALAEPAAVGGCFRLRFDAPTPGLRLIEWGARLRVALASLPYGDQALFVRRSVLEAIGGVPEVPFMEDLDLAQAMKHHGPLACLAHPVTSSARRYREGGVLRTMLRNWVALAAGRLGLDRERIREWYCG
jgi:rSAM/selenodomain-associated transferase 2